MATAAKSAAAPPVLHSTGPLIPIGTSVRLNANSLPGTIRGIWQHQSSVTQFAVEYVARTGVIHETWVRADEFTLAPPTRKR